MPSSTPSLWDLIEKGLEQVFGLLGAIFAVFIYWRYDLFRTQPSGFTSLLEASVNVSAIAVGFLAAAKAILLSAGDQQVIKALRAADQLKRLMRYFIAAIWWCLITTVLSAILLVVDLAIAPRWVLGIWMFLTGGSVAACVRVIWIYNSTLKQFH